ncbi:MULTISPECIES: sigma-54 dependent transcriptional regulator [unclassified Thiobacillus]|uniref:sigma-54-dependent transcriptional regulator n=1 Tax=unclassified Thiobacillus TaxID=2646513 RepID=UPI0008686CC0|nr:MULTISPECIES: sigma-54 dependent transcriptional regulator [unclassified Thiobacillus]MBN8778205.1 sigma-54-dependent Fis family transcriptional regulator [Thiobacillus sp.]ODV00074.1 MAG: Fis family transcriptional regulator [Thiobacillus sp. SCN 63-57]
MKGRQILVADDEPKMRRVLEIMLQKMGHRVLAAGNGVEALALFQANSVDLVITDLRMPEMDGIELLAALRAQASDVPVMVITAHGTIETAVAAMKHGACDYILRPFDIDVVELAVERVLNGAAVAQQNAFLRQEIERGWDAFVGTSEPMRAVYELIQRVGPSKASVLITGETGTGKELAARALHHASPRRDKLFVPINCAAIPADILESELFGYEKGAFTGAVKERVGKFELADGGTIFLDELTEMPLPLQAKLLRVLQENTIERLGGNRVIELDLRVIAATNRDPLESVREGTLREDLYYRVNVFSIELPPLRARTEDIAGLVEHFIAKHGHSTAATHLAPRALERLCDYDWPGNVRELENMVERALILSGGGELDEQHFLLNPRAVDNKPRPAAAPAESQKAPPPLNQAVEDLEARLIDEALAQAEGNKAKAAALLDISERTLWYKLKKYRPEQS